MLWLSPSEIFWQISEVNVQILSREEDTVNSAWSHLVFQFNDQHTCRILHWRLPGTLWYLPNYPLYSNTPDSSQYLIEYRGPA